MAPENALYLFLPKIEIEIEIEKDRDSKVKSVKPYKTFEFSILNYGIDFLDTFIIFGQCDFFQLVAFYKHVT